MSFSLSNIPRVKDIKKRNGETKKELVAKCYVLIKEQDKITKLIRLALKNYLAERLEHTSTTNLSYELLQDNIKELLEYCCDRSYNNITEKDVINSENKILQHIKWCTEYHNTKRLVFKEEDYNMYGLNSKDLGKVEVFDDTDKDMEAYLAYLEKIGG